MIVIADDITGAAEIAGIAAGHGLSVCLCCCASTAAADTTVSATDTTADVTVIATNTRSMSQAEAVALTFRLVPAILPYVPRPSTIFKKTDSALRGHVVAELSALMKATGCRRAVYAPANPSKGRIIRDGVFYVNDIPIDATAFSYDPEFPAVSSRLAERFPEASEQGISIPDVTTPTDIESLLSQSAADAILAGAADLFEAVVRHVFPAATASARPLACRSFTHATVILCGSTQSQPLPPAIPLSEMPVSVFDGGADIDLWLADARSRYSSSTVVALTMPRSHHTEKANAAHLRHAMAAVATRLVHVVRPHDLVIEGGATAFDTLQSLGLRSFSVEGQLAPGVVRMKSEGRMFVTLKPGSYPWADCLAYN